jgi:microcystin-dependent protein
MSQPFLGQIMMFGASFPPSGWMTCSGQQLDIANNGALFQLIGTTYGGDGVKNFNLPDLRGRVPVHMGQGSGLSDYQIGQNGGTEVVTLTTQQIPQHNHPVASVTGQAGNATAPSNARVLADEGSTASGGNAFTYTPFNAGSPNQVQLPAATIGTSGGNQPHNNIQPILAILYCIAAVGASPKKG